MLEEENHFYQRLFREWLAGGLANALTSGILYPMDVAKTRMQAMSKYISQSTLKIELNQMYVTGGITGLWSRGLTASMLREILSSGPRAGFYAPVRDYFTSTLGIEKKDNMLYPKIFAAMLTGILGSIIANPVDVVKIRLMAADGIYSNTLVAFRTIYFREGVTGFYKGLFPSTLRGAFIAGSD